MRTSAAMVLRRGLVVLVAVAVLGGPAAVHATTLRWKFKPGETLHYVMKQTTEVKAKPADREIKTTLTQTINMNWAVKSVGADGVAELVQTIDRIRTKVDSAFGTFDYDSNNPKDPEGPFAAQLVPLLKTLVGAQLSFKMNPQGELSDVKIPEQVTQALRGAGPAQGAGGAGMFSEEGMKNMISQSSLALPRSDLSKGQNWSQQTKVPLPTGTMVLDKRYTYQGADPQAGADIERIELDIKIDLKTDPESNIIQTIKSQEGKGFFLFDNAAGHINKSQVTEAYQTSITLMNMEFVQDTSTSTTMQLEPGEVSGRPR